MYWSAQQQRIHHSKASMLIKKWIWAVTKENGFITLMWHHHLDKVTAQLLILIDCCYQSHHSRPHLQWLRLGITMEMFLEELSLTYILTPFAVNDRLLAYTTSIITLNAGILGINLSQIFALNDSLDQSIGIQFPWSLHPTSNWIQASEVIMLAVLCSRQLSSWWFYYLLCYYYKIPVL